MLLNWNASKKQRDKFIFELKVLKFKRFFSDVDITDEK